MDGPATSGEAGTAPGFGASAVLVVVATVAAATTGSLSLVGPYLLGISVLIGALFLCARWTR